MPRQQTVDRDLAVILNEGVTHDRLMQAVHGAPTEGLLRSATVFDIYRPKAGSEAASGMKTGEKSVAIHLRLASDTVTLSESQIDAVMRSVIDQLAQQLNARVRA